MSKAILQYNSVSGNKVQRMEAEEKERAEYNAYMEEKENIKFNLIFKGGV